MPDHRDGRTALADLETPIGGFDPIPTWLANVRKCATLSTVVRLGRSGPATLDSLDLEARRLSAAAHEAPSLHQKVLTMWRIEGLVFRFFEDREGSDISLRGSSMPLAGGPAAHCGLAMAIVLQEGFDPQRLHDRFAIRDVLLRDHRTHAGHSRKRGLRRARSRFGFVGIAPPPSVCRTEEPRLSRWVHRRTAPPRCARVRARAVLQVAEFYQGGCASRRGARPA